MSDHSPLRCHSESLKKALHWVAEALHDHPEKQRLAVLREAQLRYDLTPLECEFLDKHLS
ncbi:MAG: hypothetical protein RBT36_09800 [Desulfobulbus sp.]|jgi:hypothetical protein|nr:hypothetical protein [Desulfobulbus sp.]